MFLNDPTLPDFRAIEVNKQVPNSMRDSTTTLGETLIEDSMLKVSCTAPLTTDVQAVVVIYQTQMVSAARDTRLMFKVATYSIYGCLVLLAGIVARSKCVMFKFSCYTVRQATPLLSLF